MVENTANPFADATRQFTEGQNQFQKMWSDFSQKMGASGMSFTPESTPPDAAKQMRSAFLKAWSEYCEEYMRSPEFLQSWKKSMDAAIELRRQMNQSMGKMHHDLGGTSRQDIDQLMVALSHLERRMVDNIERGAEKVNELGERIDSLERKLTKVRKAGANAKKPNKKSMPANKKSRKKSANGKKKSKKK